MLKMVDRLTQGIKVSDETKLRVSTRRVPRMGWDSITLVFLVGLISEGLLLMFGSRSILQLNDALEQMFHSTRTAGVVMAASGLVALAALWMETRRPLASTVLFGPSVVSAFMVFAGGLHTVVSGPDRASGVWEACTAAGYFLAFLNRTVIRNLLITVVLKRRVKR